MLGFRRGPVARTFKEKMGGGRVSRPFIDLSFLSHCPENFRRGIILCCVLDNFR